MINLAGKNKQLSTMEYNCNGKLLSFEKPVIMAIVNLTPDSFYDGGKYSNSNDVLYDVEEKINQGAKIIDIGAASSRPGAAEISEEDEWNRLKNYLTEIRKKFPGIILSVDTYRASIAKQSFEWGTDMINDIGGGTLDEKMVETIAQINIPYVMMHMAGSPQTMQHQAEFTDIVLEVERRFENQISKLNQLNFDKIILDPGFGFGKSLKNNYELLKHLKNFERFNYPVLVGISRKSMISKILGTNPVTALNGTTALHSIALLNGANILRVHDVMEAAQSIQLIQYYKEI
jgi:dihydropteroate synthase